MPTLTQSFRRPAVLAGLMAVVVLALMVAWLVMAVWIGGGPRPVHPIVIAIQAPPPPPPGDHPI